MAARPAHPHALHSLSGAQLGAMLAAHDHYPITPPVPSFLDFGPAQALTN